MSHYLSSYQIRACWSASEDEVVSSGAWGPGDPLVQEYGPPQWFGVYEGSYTPDGEYDGQQLVKDFETLPEAVAWIASHT